MAEKKSIIAQLQREIDALQGLGIPKGEQVQATIGPFDVAFPGHVFPAAAVHEFLSYTPADAAATSGFISALASRLAAEGICLWIGTARRLFPPALKHFGIAPDRVVFIDVRRQQDALWTIEEALKCGALSMVIGEVRDLSFTDSRRLQLAVERSRISAFIHRSLPRSENTVACTTRWKISPISCEAADGLPGVVHPRWNAELLKVRNGRPGAWQLEWSGQRFKSVDRKVFSVGTIEKRKAV